MSVYERAAEMLLNSRSTVVLTGAGISTDSGIPDFRSPGSGLWEKVDPMEALSTSVLYKDPDKFYKVGFRIIMSMRDAKPNKAHYALAKLEQEGLIDLLITQNIDNLHFKAGSKKVYEVHGNTRTCSCDRCGARYDIDIVAKKVDGGEVPPICSCKGIIRPDVVLFGDMLPQCFNDGVKAVEKADLLIVIGSSLTVSPVNYLADICKKLMIINYSETPFDRLSSLNIREGISDTLEKIIEIVEKSKR